MHSIIFILWLQINFSWWSVSHLESSSSTQTLGDLQRCLCAIVLSRSLVENTFSFLWGFKNKSKKNKWCQTEEDDDSVIGSNHIFNQLASWKSLTHSPWLPETALSHPYTHRNKLTPTHTHIPSIIDTYTHLYINNLPCVHTHCHFLCVLFSHTQTQAFRLKSIFRRARTAAHFHQRDCHLLRWRSKSCVWDILVEMNFELPPWFSSKTCPHQSEARPSISKGPNSARVTEHVISHGHTHSSKEGWNHSVWKRRKRGAEPTAAETLKSRHKLFFEWDRSGATIQCWIQPSF